MKSTIIAIFIIVSFLQNSFSQVLSKTYEKFWHSNNEGTHSLAISGRHAAWKNRICTISNLQNLSETSCSMLLTDSTSSFKEKITLKLNGKELSVSDSENNIYNMTSDFVFPKIKKDPLLKAHEIKIKQVLIKGKILDYKNTGISDLLTVQYFDEYKDQPELYSCLVDKDGLFKINFPLHHLSEVSIDFRKAVFDIICVPGDTQIIFFNPELKKVKNYYRDPQAANTEEALKILSNKVYLDSLNRQAFFMGEGKELNLYFNHFNELTRNLSSSMPYDLSGNGRMVNGKAMTKQYYYSLENEMIKQVIASYDLKLCGVNFINYAKDKIRYLTAEGMLRYMIPYSSEEEFSKEDADEITNRYIKGILPSVIVIPEFRSFIGNFYSKIGPRSRSSDDYSNDSIVAFIKSGILKYPGMDINKFLSFYKGGADYYNYSKTANPDSLKIMLSASHEIPGLKLDLVSYENIKKQFESEVVRNYLSINILRDRYADKALPNSENKMNIFHLKNKNLNPGEWEYIKYVNNELKRDIAKLKVYENSRTPYFNYLKNEAAYRVDLEKKAGPKAIIMFPHYYESGRTQLCCQYINILKQQYPTVDFRIYIKVRSRNDLDEIQRLYALTIQKNDLHAISCYISDSVSLFYEWYFGMNNQNHFKVYNAKGQEISFQKDHLDYETDWEKMIKEALDNKAVTVPEAEVKKYLCNVWKVLYNEDNIINMVNDQWRKAKDIKSNSLFSFDSAGGYRKIKIKNRDYSSSPYEIEDTGTYKLDAKAMSLTLTNTSGIVRKYKILSCGNESLIISKE